MNELANVFRHREEVRVEMLLALIESFCFNIFSNVATLTQISKIALITCKIIMLFLDTMT